MRNIRNWLTDNKLRLPTKIFLISFVLFESLLLLLGYFYYRHSADTLLKAETSYSRQLIQKSDEYLQLNLTNIQNFFLSVANDDRFQQNSFSELSGWLTDNLINYIPNAQHIHVIEDDRVVATTTPYDWLVLENQEFREQLKLIGADKRLYWTSPYFSTVSQNTVSALMRIPSPGKTKILVIDLALDRLYRALVADKSSPVQGELLLLDRKGELVFGQPPYARYDVFKHKFLLSGGLEHIAFNNNWSSMETNGSTNSGRLYMTRSQSNLMGWQLVWIMNQTELLKPIRQSLNYLWMLAGLSLLLTMGMSAIVSLYVSQPILNIAAMMGKVGKGKLQTTVVSTRKDELGLLANHFNEMTARIRQLIADLKQTEEEKKRLDFQALQTQIRPHFLYNTLNMINAVARQGKLTTVDRLITSLTDQLQYSLDMSPKPVRLREELQVAESYVQLMAARYQNGIAFEMDIERSTLELLVPKFLLQPILENSIFHGLAPKGQPGVIYISTSRAVDHWELYMEDDGVGISALRLANLQKRMRAERSRDSQEAVTAWQPLSDSNRIGIGLMNVFRRLQHSYGESFGMEIDSSEGKGTRITITLPLEETQESKGDEI